MNRPPNLDSRLRGAVRRFWETRDRQAKKQAQGQGAKDTGARAAATGGAQMSGFVELVRDILCENGVDRAQIYSGASLELPGWYRPEKKWDLLLVSNGQLIAGIEFKSQIGPSFGNNFNNRTEEAVGSATDLWAAYREGAFKPSVKPWLGYLMLLEQSIGSTSPVRNREPHFGVFPEFKDSSYAKRYQVLLTKLMRERLYDSACFLTSDTRDGRKGHFREPDPELTFEKFITSLLGKAIASKW